MPAPSNAETSAIALVTGGGRGMGAEIARMLAGDGFAIAVADIRDCSPVADEIRAAGGVAQAYQCDIRDWDGVTAVLTEVERGMGPLRTCVQVVGVTSPVSFLEMDPASWRKILDVNLDGTFNVCRLGGSTDRRERWRKHRRHFIHRREVHLGQGGSLLGFEGRDRAACAQHGIRAWGTGSAHQCRGSRHDPNSGDGGRTSGGW